MLWEAISKTRVSGFIRVSNHLETIKALGLRPLAFICFSVFGTPDETLALVGDILRPKKKCNNENIISDLVSKAHKRSFTSKTSLK